MPPSSPLDLAFKAHQEGRHPEARRAYEGILRSQPENAFCLYLLGNLLVEMGLPAEARGPLEACCRLKPELGLAHNSLGNLYLSLREGTAAKLAYEQAIACAQPCPEAFCNLGGLLRAEGKAEEALALYDRVLSLKPDFVEALCNRSVALKSLGRFTEARRDLLDALQRQPSLPEARFNLGLLQLLEGEFQAGWAHHELRWETEQRHARRSFAFPALQPNTELKGRRVLVYAEQGLGDTLQFCRFLPRLAALGAEVHLEVQPPLLPVIKGLAGLAGVYPSGASLPVCHYHCALLSLPWVLGLQTEDDLRMTTPYLRVPAEARIDPLLNQFFEKTGHPHVGLVWFGNRHHRNDRQRSLDSASLSSALQSVSYPLLSLQVGAKDALEQSLLTSGRLWDAAPFLKDFGDTAAVLSRLDWLVTVDTSVAHLAGALGIPVRLLLPHAPDWRWLLQRADSPWYPSFELYRQTAPGVWTQALAQALASK